MRIKKLELVGFKSFKDRTVIQFDAGITGIVGPNGCGKSNIVDAMQWVMGEMSAKHLRGTAMSDVIFGGAEGYAPSGMAEVTMVLENDGGPFPAKYLKHSEIQVTRRLHRSGESEYLVNKEPARLRDIHEVFMDTGAGSKGFSIIEQGAIGKIVVAKPEERRVLIEEAAGITKFKARKRESQRKLQATEQNLMRIGDIVTELKRQLDSLQRQAKKAARYREIRKEAQELDLMICSKEFYELQEKSTEARKTVEEGESLNESIRAKISELESQNESERLQQLELEKKIETKQVETEDIQKNVREKEKRIQELHFEVEQAKRQAVIQGDLKAEAETRKEMLEKEAAEVQSVVDEVKQRAESLQKEYEELSEKYQHIQKRLRDGEDEITAHRRDLVATDQAKTQLQIQLETQKSRREDSVTREEESQVVLGELNEKKTEFEKDRKAVFEKLENERQLQLSIMGDVENFEENRDMLEKNVKEKREEVDGFKDKLNEVTSRLYGLENLHANFEGFESGVKSVMLWKREAAERVGGGSEGTSVKQMMPVADAVEVPKEYEVAMEAALGSRLQMLLSADKDDAMNALNYLKENNSGRSSFISSDLTPSEEASNTPSGDGVVGLMKDVVTAPENFRPTVTYLLDQIAIVDSLGTALKLRPTHAGWTFVTRDGDTLTSDGVLTGGSADSADTGVLKRRREIKELSEAKEEWAGKLSLAQSSLKKLEGQLETLAADLEKAQQEKLEKEVLIAELKKDMERADREVNNINTAVTRQESELQKIIDARVELDEKIGHLESEIETLIGRRRELDGSIEEIEKELSEYRDGFEDLREKVTQLRGDSAAADQEAQGRQRQLDMVQQQLNDVNDRIQRMSDESDENTNQMSDNQMELEQEKVNLDRLMSEAKTSQEGLSQLRNEYEKLGHVLRDADTEIGELRKQQNESQTAWNEAQLTMEKSELRLAAVEEHIRERYMVELADKAPEYRGREFEHEEATSKLDDLRGRLKRMGEVNLAAVEEFDELSERYEFLSKQQQDLIDAKEQLRKVIDRINRICNRRFKETFAAVNDRFKQVFPVLFGGGEAHLTLVENEDKQEMGIDITAKPPGKKPQSVTLLSGGEKALTAVSLIFSIFLVKPSPYCLLDEVDAPLDDANVYRFNELVREMAKRSQIIVVTHNKHTMEMTEKLYGVTQEDKGVSKMVSVDITAS